MSQPEGPERWIPVLVVYTGMTNKELENLSCSVVRQCDETGIWYLQISRSKTEAATRAVPIAQPVIDAGFIDYVRSRDGALFDVNAKWLTRRYQTIKKDLCLPDDDQAGHALTMYSMRHTVIYYLRETGANSGLTHDIVGHEGRKKVHDAYTKRGLFRLEIKKKYVDVLPYRLTPKEASIGH